VLPRWVINTPYVSFTLSAMNRSLDNRTDSAHDQDISLTLQEYEALKGHLATMRGYRIPKPSEESNG
jgi:hypothetical protein